MRITGAVVALAAVVGVALALPAQARDVKPDLADIIATAVDAKDRPEDDRKLDDARRPKDMLAFFTIRPGMKVLDMFTGSGWYAELESRVVGPKGEVWAQNPPQFIEKFGDKKIAERLSGDRLPNVRRWDKSLDALELPKGYFDGVIANDVFHDFFWLSKDVDGIVKQVFEALKPGGFFAIVDHAAPEGTGDTYAKEFKGQHRVDEALVKEKLLNAGFKLEAESSALRNPADDRTKAFYAPEMKGKNTDKFALLFRKPH
jgi:predicted methyltransferase